MYTGKRAHHRLGIVFVLIVCIAFTFAACASTYGTSTAGALPITQATHAPTHAPTATPKPKPTATPVPTDTPLPPPPAPTCIPGAINCNPWGYNFAPGNLIYNPPGDFCSFFNCIANFYNGRGYVIQCVDGTFSKSGGIQGACSFHHGVRQPLYSH